MAPLFWAQLLGALVDSLLRTALISLISGRAIQIGALDPRVLVSLAGAAFVLPFLLFSGLAGHLSDKHPKAAVLRWAKLAEVPVVALAAAALVTEQLAGLLACLFLLGTQATFFGPAKYAILGELLPPSGLIRGTALVATATFGAILLGALASQLWIGALPTLALIAVVLSLAGAGAGLLVPRSAPGAEPTLSVRWGGAVAATRSVRSVFLSALGISWFWFLGSAILAVLPVYATDGTATRALVVFCGGLAVGALATDALARHRIELGLVPLGSLVMTIGLVDLGWSGDRPDSARALLDLGLVAVGSGLYTVPLYAMIQDRTAPARRARVIAGNNVLNALFMAASLLLVHGAAALGWPVSTLFLVLAALNVAVAFYIYQVIPEFLLRLVLFVLAHLMYRLRVRGLEQVPARGPAILVANHVTFVDWLLVAAAMGRPPRFVMYHGYFRMPVVGWFFRDGKVIPIAPAHESEDTMQQAFDRIAAELAEGELVCLFPEGKLSKTGAMEPFRTGIERIVARTPVPVVPMALLGLWGSAFSRKPGRKLFRRFRSPVELRIGAPIPPQQVTARGLAEAVAALGGFAVPPPPEPRRG